MEVRVGTLESKKQETPAKPVQQAKPVQKAAPKKNDDDDDDDVDLFGSESEVNIILLLSSLKLYSFKHCFFFLITIYCIVRLFILHTFFC